MAKRKLSIATTNNNDIQSDINHRLLGDSPTSSPQSPQLLRTDDPQPIKRQRVVPLNFSIESIMQPHQNHLHEPSARMSSDQSQFQSRSPSPAPSTSTTSSRASADLSSASRSSFCSQDGRRDRAESVQSPDICSTPITSRVSTPISPGYCQTEFRINSSKSSSGIQFSQQVLNRDQAPISGRRANEARNISGGYIASRTDQAGTSSSHSLNMSSSERLNQVDCVLDNKDMWDKFHSLNTEMIITKTGRRMFPVLKVQFHNLDPKARYAVSMDIVPVDNKRYRYAYHKSCWQVAGKADPSAEPRLYPHPDSPFNGDLLSRQVISFEKVKLTNNEMDKSGHIILNSMHKYQPRVHLIELKSTILPQTQTQIQKQSAQQHQHNKFASSEMNGSRYSQQNAYQKSSSGSASNQPVAQLDIEGYRTYVFPETVFTAVTAYQNQLITKMKIDKNPFAKGFRDSSRLSDLDRNDPFDYMGSLGPAAACAAAAAAAAAAHSGNRAFTGGGGGGGGGHLTPSSQSNGSLMSMADQGSTRMDQAYAQLLAAAQNPWYAAAAAAAAAAAGGNPFSGPPNSMPTTSTPTSSSTPTIPQCPMTSAQNSSQQQQQQQLQATQMWLAAFSACLNGNGQPSGQLPSGLGPPPPSLGSLGMLASNPLGLSPLSNGPGGNLGSSHSSAFGDGRSPPVG